MPTAKEKQLVALERALQTLREEENADVLIETTLNYLQTEFEYNLIWIGLYDRLDHRLFGKGGITPTGDTTLLKSKFFLNPGDILEQVVIQQRPVGIPDLRQEVRAGEWRKAAQQFGIQGTLLLPLRCKDRCYGVALLGSYQWGISPSASDKALLSLLFGGLASALYQIEVDWQHSSTKRPDQVLFQVISQIAKVASMQQRLEAIVSTTQQFVTPTRTSLYWFEAQGRYFWLRVGSQQKARAIASPLSGSSGLLVQEISEFYLALVVGQTVAIGAGRSPLKAEVTGRLMKRLRARSLLAAPIIVGKELIGFLAVEGNEPRIWEEAEKNYVRAAANLVALVAESESAIKVQEQSIANTQLVAQVANAVANNTDSQAALQKCATLLLERLGVERFLWFKEDTLNRPESEKKQSEDSSTQNSPLQLIYQQVRVPNRRAITTFLPVPSREAPIVAIENWEEDERLLSWKSPLMQVGVRSLLVCRISSPQTVNLLVLCHGNPRTWSRTEQELVSIVGQQIALMWQIQSSQSLAQLESSSRQTLHSGLNAFSSFPQEPDAFEKAFIAFLADLLACPLAALLRWTSEQPAQVAVSVVASPNFALPPDLTIYPDQEPLIQDALTTDGLLERQIQEIPETRRWLSRTSTGCLLVMALPDFGLGLTHEKPKSIVLLADKAQRQWPSHLLPVVETLVRQFARYSGYLRSYKSLEREVIDMQEMNWYKHKCLETFHKAVATSIGALVELPFPKVMPVVVSMNEAAVPGLAVRDEVSSRREGAEWNVNPSPLHPNIPALEQNSTPESLRRMRSSQLLHQMENSLATLSPLLDQEQWQLTLTLTQIPLANLLKRLLLLLTPLTKQRQLSVTVHIPSTERVCGDRLKLECVLFELLLSTARSYPRGGRMNIWCHQISSSVLEVLITNKIALERINTESSRMNEELFSPSKEPDSLNLKICQRVVRSWGGDLQFCQFEGSQYTSRLLLPRPS